VIPWAAPVADPKRSENGRPFTVGMIGRIARWKGQHIFVEAFSKASLPGDARALVVGAPLFGPDEEEYLAELHELVRARGLGGRVRFTGFVDDAASVLDELDALVHASSIPEPFGQVVVEGMAAGVPVIAAGAGGPLELIADGIDGLLCPPGDVAALAACLTRLGEDSGLRHRLGAAGRKRAEQYSPSDAAARVRDVYEDVLARRPCPMQPVEAELAAEGR
jgi:glycosyltransferase involved in cell wall biosynthesis